MGDSPSPSGANSPGFAHPPRFLFCQTAYGLRLHLVQVLVQGRDAGLQPLALAAVQHDLPGQRGAVHGVALEDLPVVEHALREGLATGVATEITREAEGLLHGEVGLHVVDRGALAVLLTNDNPTPLVQHGVHASDGVLDGLDLDQEDGLQQAGLGEHLHGIDVAASGGDHLATTTVDGIGVQGDIVDVVADPTHVLRAQHTLLGGPLPGRHEGVLDLVHVSNTLGHVNDHVGPLRVRSEAPDLAGIAGVPVVGIREEPSSGLRVVARRDLVVLNVVAQLLIQGLALGEDSVVLIGGLAQGNILGGLGDGLTEGHHGLGDLQLAAHEVVLQILQADFQVELSCTSNDVLASLLNRALHQGVGLGQPLQALNQLGQVTRVLGLNGHTHHRGHAVLHVLDGERVLGVLLGNGGGLDDELIHPDQADQVPRRDIVHSLLVAPHHQHCPLDVLDVEVVLASHLEVGPHDAHLLARLAQPGEDTPKGKEPPLVAGRHHFADVQHEGRLLVALLNASAVLVVGRARVEGLRTVGLGLNWGRQLGHNHVQQRIRGGQPLLHDGLQKLFGGKILLLSDQLDAERAGHLLQLLLLLVHHGLEHLGDGVPHKLAERALHTLPVLVGVRLDPLLPLLVVEVVAPQAGHHLVNVHTELGRVHLGKLVQAKGPALQPRTKGNRPLLGEHLAVSQRFIVVGRHHHVHRADGAGERLVRLLGVQLKLKDGAVHLVHVQHGLDTLRQSLAKHSLRLHADTLHAVHHDHRTVRHTKGGSHLGGKVHVPWGVNEVDQEIALRVLGKNVRADVVVQRDRCGLDGDAAVLLVLPCVSQPAVTSLGHGNDSGSSDERVGQSRLPVVDVSNHGHVPHLLRELHDRTHLIDGEVNHFAHVSRYFPLQCS
eukprot:RCo021167